MDAKIVNFCGKNAIFCGKPAIFRGKSRFFAAKLEFCSDNFPRPFYVSENTFFDLPRPQKHALIALWRYMKKGAHSEKALLA